MSNKIGKKDLVTVKGTRQYAHVIGEYKDIDGGVVLDRTIEGFRSWNICELILIKKNCDKIQDSSL